MHDHWKTVRNSFVAVGSLVLVVLITHRTWSEEKSATAAKRLEPKIARLIDRAGNADDELQRLRLLREIKKTPGLDARLQADLDVVIELSDLWSSAADREVPYTARAAENGYLCYFFHGRLRRGYPPKVDSNSPVYPIWCLHRARMLTWNVLQGGPPEMRKTYFAEAYDLFRQVKKAYPNNRIARMYLGEPIPWPKTYPADPNAPDWANLQREALEKLADIIHWWIDHRQLEDGQLGGGWGDDCETWKGWPVMILGFHDPKIAAAQARLSNGLFAQPHMTKGFTSFMADVEHTAEDTSDTITPMMHLRRDDPVWPRRALRLADLMRNLWTGVNQRGTRQFKNIRFNVDRVLENPQSACDTVYHPKVVQPTLLYWQRTGDAKLGKLFTAWMDTWVDATAREENGKPAGVIPGGIHWPSGTVAVGAEGKWWDLDRTLYDWPSAMFMTTNTLLLTYHMTGDAKYLEPIRSMARIRAEHLARAKTEPPKPGSAAWCARRMNAGQGRFLNSLAKYRLLTGDGRFDKLLMTEASAYMRYRLDKDEKALAGSLLNNARAFRVNWPAYTSEVRYTDRIFAMSRARLHPSVRPMPRTNSALMYATVTGDPDDGLSYFPMGAVRWLTPPREIAALVTETGKTRFAAKLYHFGDMPRPVEAELFLLTPGEYTLTLKTVANEAAESAELLLRSIQVDGPTARVAFQLPPRKLCSLCISAAGGVSDRKR